MSSIDLNADMGEECGDDAALLAVVTTANVAAGGHAGGGDVLTRTVARAAAAEVAVGAHPSYADRDGFGRVSRLADHDPRWLTTAVREQILTVAASCSAHGIRMTHVKAHGALYHDVVAYPEAAGAFLQAARDVSADLGWALAVLGPPSASLQDEASGVGLPYVVEAFADRRYRADGSLVARSESGAVLHDPADVVDQAVSLARDRRVRSREGTWIEIDAASICLHGDTPDAVTLAAAVRAALEAEGIAVQHPPRP